MAASAQFILNGTPQKICSTSIHDQSIKIHAHQACYVGSTSAVSTSTGFLMDNGDKTDFLIDGGAELWAISSGSSSTISIFVNIT
jgi:hypothetical protein